MSVISTHLNDNAQTPLGRFVDDTLYNQIATNTVTNRTDGLKP